MTLCIVDITKEEAEKFLLADPLLCERALADKDLEEIKTIGECTSFNYSEFIGVYHDNILICVNKWEYFTNVSANIHTYIMSALHGKDVTIEIQAVLKQWYMHNTDLAKIVILAPASCKNVHKAVDISGFVLEGILTRSVAWRGKIEDIHVYGLDLNRLRKL